MFAGAVSTLLVVLTPAMGAAGQPTGGPSAFVRARGSVPALPPGSRDTGQVSGSLSLSVDVTLKPQDPAGLEAFDEAVSTPGSSSFRHFLAPGQFASRFGPDPSTVAAVRSWLSGEGLTVGTTTSDGLIIPVQGSAAAMSRVFGVTFQQIRIPSGRLVRMPNAEPLVPAALSSQVGGVVGLDDLGRPESQIVRRSTINGASDSAGSVGGASRGGAASRTASGSSSGRAPLSRSFASSAGPHASCGAAMQDQGLTADQLAQAYSFSSLYASGNEGQGVTIGLYELEPYSTGDISTYDGCYTPAISAPVTPVTVDGAHAHDCDGVSSEECQPGGSDGEAALDIEAAQAMAPQGNIEVYVGSDEGNAASNSAALDTYAAMVNQDTAKIISTSWGECERDLGMSQVEAEGSLFEQAVAQGQTVVSAGGDSGSEGCYGDETPNQQALDVDDPAGQPWLTSVGGTTMAGCQSSLSSCALGPPPSEQVWNDGVIFVENPSPPHQTITTALAGGGGTSGVWTMPSWQLGPGVQSSYTSPTTCPESSGAGTVSCREVPDVSMDADPLNSPFAEYWDGQWLGVGGTSMGAPIWAAIFALAEEGSPQLGNADAALYEIARCAGNSPFNDITQGNNQLPAPYGPTDENGNTLSGGPYYPATSNYDLASGLGTPEAAALVPDLRNPPSCALPTSGYRMVASDGGIFTFGNSRFFGSTGSIHLNQPIVAMASTPDGNGYWLVASDGGIFTFGDAGFFGSTGALRLNKPIVGMAPTPDGGGYWLVASDGGIFTFGNASFDGSTGALRLNKPIVGMAPTPDGGGYWLVASDGGIFTFGDAPFEGSAGALPLNKPIVGMAPTRDGGGYWLVASDGGIFTYGDAPFDGSAGALPLKQPIVGMAPTPDGRGYWLVASDGGIFTYGDAPFYGSTGALHLNRPVVGMTSNS